MEKRKFEDSFRDAFQKAELSPPEDVWTNIELDLEKLEGGKMRRRLLFFKLLAAASVVFAMVIGGVGYFVMQEQATNGSPSGTISETHSPQATQPDASGDVLADSATPASEEGESTVDDPTIKLEGKNENIQVAEGSQNERINSSSQTGRDNTSQGNSQGHDKRYASLLPGDQNMVAEVNTSEQMIEAADGSRGAKEPVFRDRPLPPLVRARKPVIQFPKTRPDKWDLLMASIEMEEKREKEKSKASGEKVWTSVGFSAGTFSNLSSGGTPMASADFNTAAPLASQNFSALNTISNETRASGSTYAMGISMGGRITGRWVLQGGLNFISQTSDYSSNAVVTSDYQNFKTLNAVEATRLGDQYSSSRLVPTASYSVSNNIQFLSIPLQAGYVIINRSFALQINGGVSTDLFLQNVATPEGSSLDKVTTTNGDDSPYRSVNFVGLAGTELSYRFADRYRISLNPGVRYPLQSIYKSDVGFDAVPVTFDVGLRFRYIFR